MGSSENGVRQEERFVSFYTQDGVVVDRAFYDAPEEFNVYVLPGQDMLCFSGDRMLSDACSLLVSLEGAIQKAIFEDPLHYGAYLSQTSILLAEGGLSSDCFVSKDRFNVAVGSSSSDVLNAVLYVSEYISLQGCLLNAFEEMGMAMAGFFKSLVDISLLPGCPDEEEGTFRCLGHQTNGPYAFVSSFFVCAAACLDYLSKCVYECVNLPDDFALPQKLRSAGVLYRSTRGAERRIATNGTIFEGSPLINLIEDVRNDVVHNKSINEPRCVLVDVSKGSAKRRYLPFPDFDANTGRLHKWHSRNRFYSQGNTMNELLPKLYFELMSLALGTLDALLKYLKGMEGDRNLICFDADYGEKVFNGMRMTFAGISNSGSSDASR